MTAKCEGYPQFVPTALYDEFTEVSKKSIDSLYEAETRSFPGKPFCQALSDCNTIFNDAYQQNQTLLDEAFSALDALSDNAKYVYDKIILPQARQSDAKVRLDKFRYEVNDSGKGVLEPTEGIGFNTFTWYWSGEDSGTNYKKNIEQAKLIRGEAFNADTNSAATYVTSATISAINFNKLLLKILGRKDELSDEIKQLIAASPDFAAQLESAVRELKEWQKQYFTPYAQQLLGQASRGSDIVKCATTYVTFEENFQSRMNKIAGRTLINRDKDALAQLRDFWENGFLGDAETNGRRASEVIEARDEGAGVVTVNADKAIYQEQCFLLSQIPQLLKLKNKVPPRLPYTGKRNKNAPLSVFDEPFGFMNRMTQAKHSRALFNLTTSQISSLVPTIRLYKVITSPKTGEDLAFVEIKFDTHPGVKSYTVNSGGDGRQRPVIAKQASALDLFESKRKRGVGVGLKDFNFTFHGSDPFAAKKAIQAKVSIFATSFGDLIATRIGTPEKLSKNADKNEISGEYKFADLALKTGKTPEDLRNNLSSIQKDNLDKLNFRLKVVLGWAIPQNYLSSFTEEDRDAVNDSFVNLNLTPTTHEFNFDEMGGLTFDINYLAYIEDYFNNSMFNIFATKGVEANRIGRRLMYDYLTNTNCESGDIDKLKQADAESIQKEKMNSFRKIVSDLSLQKRILYYNLSYNQISKFIRTGKPPTGVSLIPSIDGNINTDSIDKIFASVPAILQNPDAKDAYSNVKNDIQVALFSTSREKNKISFFFISDLLDIIMFNIETTLEQLIQEADSNNSDIFNYAQRFGQLEASVKQNLKKYSQEIKNQRPILKEIEKLRKALAQFKKLRFVLGPIEIKDPFQTNNTFPCTIGDIPISLNYFLDFLTEKQISRDEVVYPLSNFIKDLTTDIIRNFLNTDSCFSFNTKQRIKFNSATVSCFNRSENKSYPDDISYFIRSNRVTAGKGNILQMLFYKGKEKTIFPVLQVSGPSRDPVQTCQPDREINYQIFYAGRSTPTNLMTGKESKDAENGIFHYVLGKDRGLVKNISLDRTDMQGLKELRFEQEGFNGLTQLREVYNANIDCMLNLHTFPGTYIYVEPRGFSPEAGINYSQFGIGGYYMITRSDHSIGPGKANTKITAKWVAAVGNTETDKKEKQIVSENDSSPRKCVAVKREQSFLDKWNDIAVNIGDTTAAFYSKLGSDE